MRRAFGLFFGVATQALFLATVPCPYRFLAGHEPRGAGGAAWIDALLALQFVVGHSLLLHPAASGLRRRLSRWITPALLLGPAGRVFELDRQPAAEVPAGSAHMR